MLYVLPTTLLRHRALSVTSFCTQRPTYSTSAQRKMRPACWHHLAGQRVWRPHPRPPGSPNFLKGWKLSWPSPGWASPSVARVIPASRSRHWVQRRRCTAGGRTRRVIARSWSPRVSTSTCPTACLRGTPSAWWLRSHSGNREVWPCAFTLFQNIQCITVCDDYTRVVVIMMVINVIIVIG